METSTLENGKKAKDGGQARLLKHLAKIHIQGLGEEI